MKKAKKELVVAELTERLRTAETLLVADYRGLTMPQIDALRTRLLESGARFSVVKNTLGRRAAEAAGTDSLLTLLEGPSAIAFLQAEGDMVAAAKALADMARESKILVIKGGVLQGRAMSAAEVESLATLPPLDVLRGQVLAAIIAPVTALLGLVTAPLQNLYGLIDARIEMLGGASAADETAAPEASVAESEGPVLEADAADGETAGEATPAASAPAETPPATEEPQPEASPEVRETEVVPEVPEASGGDNVSDSPQPQAADEEPQAEASPEISETDEAPEVPEASAGDNVSNSRQPEAADKEE